MRNIATLSLPAFEVLWEGLRAGSIPHPFDVPQHGETLDERARIKSAVHADLERRSLVRRGRPEPELEDALMLLARPDLRIVALGMPNVQEDALIRASVVARGGYAVLARQTDTAMTLDLVQDNALVASLVSLIPQMRPGPGKAVTVPASALQENAPVQEGFRQQVRATGNEEVRQLKQMLSGQTIGTGHFTVALGKKQFPPVTWVDTQNGRYVNMPGRNGPDWITVAPADNHGLAHHLAQVLSMTSQR